MRPDVIGDVLMAQALGELGDQFEVVGGVRLIDAAHVKDGRRGAR
jgi:hypothetical protein